MSSNIIDFEQLKKTIIPYFVEIYGEEYENLIVDRINKIVPVFYSTLDGQQSFMYDKQSKKRVELTFKFLEWNNISLSEETKLEAIKNGFDKIPEAYKLLKFYFGDKTYTKSCFYDVEELIFQSTDKKATYKITESINRLKLMGISVTAENYDEWLLTNEAKELANRIKNTKAFISQLDDEYNEFDSQFDDLRVTMDKANQIKRTLEEKYLIDFLQSIEVYMTDDDKELLHNYMNYSDKSFYQLKNELHILKIIGEDFRYDGLIESFGADCNRKLISESTSEYIKKTIISNRIKYYELLGIYDGKIPPAEFLETDLAKSNLPKQEFIDDIISKKEQTQCKYDDELLILLSNYNECMEKLSDLDLLDRTPIDDCLEIIKNSTMCINPSVKRENNEFAPILFFSPELCIKEYVDVMFIHEINHVIETTLLECTNGSIRYKTGFEELTFEINERKFEKFSENINQLIAMLVTEEMHKDGVYLFDDPVNSKIKGSTSYEHYDNFTFKFFAQFKNEIMLSRVSNDLSPLLDIVGDENFKNLNQIINRYAALPYYEMMNAIINKKETIYTKEREQLLNASFDVFDAMVIQANSVYSDEMVSNNVK